MKTKIKDDDFMILKRDIDKIAYRPLMYISSIGPRGVFHLCKEIIDNANDECYKKDSPGDTIEITIDDKMLTCRDNGRGIPTNLLKEVFETLQAGSNMTRSSGSTKGENGAGSACVLAMSKYLKLVSTRPSEKKRLTLIYEDRVLKKELLEDYNGSDSGMYVEFMPDGNVLTTDKIPIDLLTQWLNDFDYTLPGKINMTYTIKGKSYKVKQKSLTDFLKERIKDEEMLCIPVTFSCHNKLKETFMNKTYNRTVDVDVALVYTSDEYKEEEIYHSWMNMINTYDNGDHVDGVLKGLTKFIIEKISEKNKRYEGSITTKDVLSHLNIVVKASSNMAHMFGSQTKHKVEEAELRRVITEATYDSLSKLNQSRIMDIMDVVIANHRVRVEGEKARNVAKVTREDRTWTQPKSLIPCAMNTKSKHPKEFFIVEGDSAAGGLRAARFAEFQAIFKQRGKSLAVWDLPLDRVLKSDVWRDIVKCLGCGIGPTFNIKKLKYDKIIIETDADIDGFHIRVINLEFFLKFYPELIQQGHVYIGEPPLYRLANQNGKGYYYVATQNEFIDKCIETIGDVNLKFPYRNDEIISAAKFVSNAFDYLTKLREISADRNVNSQFLEHIAFGFVKYGPTVDKFIKNINKWIRSLSKIYPELGFDYDTHQINAVVDLHDQLVVLDDELLQDLSYIINIQSEYGMFVEYKSRRANINKLDTLSTFFVDIEKYYPVIKNRYKGLGSSPAKISREVIMDPATRRIMRVTMNDINLMRQMDVLLSKDKDCIKARKEMLMNFEFTKADIDN